MKTATIIATVVVCTTVVAAGTLLAATYLVEPPLDRGNPDKVAESIVRGLNEGNDTAFINVSNNHTGRQMQQAYASLEMCGPKLDCAELWLGGATCRSRQCQDRVFVTQRFLSVFKTVARHHGECRVQYLVDAKPKAGDKGYEPDGRKEVKVKCGEDEDRFYLSKREGEWSVEGWQFLPSFYLKQW